MLLLQYLVILSHSLEQHCPLLVNIVHPATQNDVPKNNRRQCLLSFYLICVLVLTEIETFFGKTFFINGSRILR